VVEHGLKAFLAYEVLLILNREKHDRQCCYSGEVALTQVSKNFWSYRTFSMNF
jgi:hypothetical protein